MTAKQSVDQAQRLVLAKLPGLGPARLRWLMSEGASVAEVIESLKAGQLPPGLSPPRGAKGPELVRAWFAAASSINPDDLLESHRQKGVSVLGPESELWPFINDPEPPLLITYAGNIGLLKSRPAVAIIGTRRCTTVGRKVAAKLGADLAEAGVAVVSGLANGIDAASHMGALKSQGTVLGVVGTGLDVVYPRSNRELWGQVSNSGLLISEYPVGTTPENWRFPARNRLIAALADIVVVVESHTKGGSLHTVDEANDRGRIVMAVPGSVTSAASAGTNQLLVDGCSPARNAADVLDALSINTCSVSTRPSRPAVPDRQPLSLLQGLILAEVETGGVHIDDLIQVAGISIVDLLALIQSMAQAGLVALDGSTVLPGANT